MGQHFGQVNQILEQFYAFKKKTELAILGEGGWGGGGVIPWNNAVCTHVRYFQSIYL